MSKLFDATAIRDDAAYWDALAARVAANAARRSNGSGFAWLAHSRTSWLAASLLLATALAFMLIDNASGSRPGAAWEQALAPEDAVAEALVRRDAPPAIGALLLSRARGG